MNVQTAESQLQKMLSIIYQIPMCLIEADEAGNILVINAKSIQLLMPLFHIHQLKGNNINELLQVITPDVLTSLTNIILRTFLMTLPNSTTEKGN